MGWPDDRIAAWQDDGITGWQNVFDDQMTRWQDYQWLDKWMTGWPDDLMNNWMTGGLNDGMTVWPDDGMTGSFTDDWTYGIFTYCRTPSYFEMFYIYIIVISMCLTSPAPLLLHPAPCKYEPTKTVPWRRGGYFAVICFRGWYSEGENIFWGNASTS